MLISGAAVLAMQITAAATAIGVGAASRDGEICIAMSTGAFAPGMTVTLIQPGPRQSVLSATIARPVPSCERLQQAMISGPYYLTLTEGATPKVSASHTPWVVFQGRLRTRELPSGVITVQLTPAYPNAQVRSCTSQEGLHLTVWAGAPLKSDRLWHAYYYLGYDVEPTCTNRDVREEAGLVSVRQESHRGVPPDK